MTRHILGPQSGRAWMLMGSGWSTGKGSTQSHSPRPRAHSGKVDPDATGKPITMAMGAGLNLM